jgi:hypothetical protein
MCHAPNVRMRQLQLADVAKVIAISASDLPR